MNCHTLQHQIFFGHIYLKMSHAPQAYEVLTLFSFLTFKNICNFLTEKKIVNNEQASQSTT